MRRNLHSTGDCDISSITAAFWIRVDYSVCCDVVVPANWTIQPRRWVPKQAAGDQNGIAAEIKVLQLTRGLVAWNRLSALEDRAIQIGELDGHEHEMPETTSDTRYSSE
jgi:hypothetical protein